jgi:hypothetical protein
VTAPALPDLAAQIEREHRAAHTAARSALEHALRCGELLIATKAKVGHGQWQQWIKTNLSFGQRMASNHMRLARQVPQLAEPNRQRVADLSIRDALGEIASIARAFRALPADAGANVIADAEHELIRCSLSRAQTQVQQLQRTPIVKDEDCATVWIGGAPVLHSLPPPDDVLLAALRQTIARFALPPMVVLETLNALYCEIQDEHLLVTPAGLPALAAVA